MNQEQHRKNGYDIINPMDTNEIIYGDTDSIFISGHVHNAMTEADRIMYIEHARIHLNIILYGEDNGETLFRKKIRNDKE
jgi:hypothetical protein